MKIAVLMNHKLTDEQLRDLKENWGIDEVVEPDSKLKEIWANIPPELDTDELKIELEDVEDWIFDMSTKCDAAIIVGEPTAALIMQNRWILDFDNKFLLFATTKREVVEELQEDGTVTKKSEFKHIKFRKVDAND